MKKLFLLAAALVVAVSFSNAQPNWKLNSNAAMLGIGALSVGGEIEVAPKWTVEGEVVGAFFNWWKALKVSGVSAVVEGRWYLTETFSGHHFGAFLEGCYFGKANVALPGFGGAKGSADMKNVKAIGIGAAYGYAYNLTENWGLDGTIGLGAGVGSYERNGKASGTKFIPVPRLQVAVTYKF